MSLELTTGWSALLEFIRARCTETEYENWIAPIRLLSESADEVHVEVPNLFVQEYLQENFGDLLREFLPPNTIRFSIAETKAVHLSAPVAPDAERCAFPCVASSISSSGTGPLAATLANRRCRIQRCAHLSLRL